MNKIKQNPVLIFLCLFIASLPFKLILAPITLGLLIVSVFFYGKKRAMFESISEHSTFVILLFLFGLHTSEAVFSTKISLMQLGNSFLLFIIPLVLVAMELKEKEILILKKAYVLSWAGFSAISLISLAFNLITKFENSHHYNFVQTSMYHFHFPYDVLYINVAYAFMLFNNIFKKYNYIIGLVYLSVIILFGTRMGIFLFTLVSLFYAAYNFKKVLKLKNVLAMIFVVSMGLLMVKSSKYTNDKFFDTLKTLGLKTENYITNIGTDYHRISLRQKLWLSSKEAYLDSSNKFLGYGVEKSAAVLDKIYASKGYDFNNMNSHNQYVSTTLNHGVIGLILLLLIFGNAAYVGIKTKSTTSILTLCLIMCAFFTESMLYRQKGVIIFALVLSLILVEEKRDA